MCDALGKLVVLPHPLYILPGKVPVPTCSPPGQSGVEWVRLCIHMRLFWTHRDGRQRSGCGNYEDQE